MAQASQVEQLEIPTPQQYSDMYWSLFEDGHYRAAMAVRITAEADYPGWQLSAETEIVYA